MQPVGPGLHVLRWTYRRALFDGEADRHGALFLNGFTLLDSVDRWACSQGVEPALAGPRDDPDGDGHVNVVEFALGSDPTASEGDLFRFDRHRGLVSFARRVLHPLAEIRVEVSEDLAHWEAPPQWRGHASAGVDE